MPVKAETEGEKPEKRTENGTELLTIPYSQDVFKMKIPLVPFSSFKSSSHTMPTDRNSGRPMIFLLMLA